VKKNPLFQIPGPNPGKTRRSQKDLGTKSWAKKKWGVENPGKFKEKGVKKKLPPKVSWGPKSWNPQSPCGKDLFCPPVRI